MMWERMKGLLEPALDGTHTMDDVLAEIQAGSAQLWAFERSAVVTQLAAYPKGSALRVWLAGGDLEELTDNIHILDDFGRDHGCVRIEIDGRKGWQRTLAPFGYRPERVVLVKEL